jgi:hypothetical protein
LSVCQLKQVFEPYCLTFKELKGKQKQLPITMFCKENKKKQKILIYSFVGAVNYSGIFAFRRGLGT